MADDIQPALTPEEWATARGEQDWQREMGVDPPMHDAIASAAAALCNIPVAPKRRRHALAALALDGQPFGFTREDLAVLSRGVPMGSGYHEVDWNDTELAAADRALAKLAALLDRAI